MISFHDNPPDRFCSTAAERSEWRALIAETVSYLLALFILYLIVK